MRTTSPRLFGCEISGLGPRGEEYQHPRPPLRPRALLPAASSGSLPVKVRRAAMPRQGEGPNGFGAQQWMAMRTLGVGALQRNGQPQGSSQQTAIEGTAAFLARFENPGLLFTVSRLSFPGHSKPWCCADFEPRASMQKEDGEPRVLDPPWSGKKLPLSSSVVSVESCAKARLQVASQGKKDVPEPRCFKGDTSSCRERQSTQPAVAPARLPGPRRMKKLISPAVALPQTLSLSLTPALSFARVEEEGATLFPGASRPPKLFGEAR